MKTRRSLSNLDSAAKTEGNDTPTRRKSLSKKSNTPTSSKKEVNSVPATSEKCVNSSSNGNSESGLSSNVYNSPIVRVLRSRVVTSDTEDEVKSSRTPKRRLSRGNLKEDKHVESENDKTSVKAEAKKSPESSVKRKTRQSLFSIVEMEENEDATKGFAPLKDEKSANEIHSSTVNEDIILEDQVKEEDFTINVNESKDALRTPASTKKRSSLMSESKETPFKAEGKKKEKTPKSSGKRSSFERSFQVAGNDDNEGRVQTIEDDDSVKDSANKDKSSSTETAKEFDSEKTLAITIDNIGRHEGSSGTNEELVTKEKSTETECGDTKSNSFSRETIERPSSARKSSSLISESKTLFKECVDSMSKIERTPGSGKRSSSFMVERSRTPSEVDEEDGKTPKSSKKKSTFQDSLKVVEMEDDEARGNTIESLASFIDEGIKSVYSPKETAEELDYEKSSVIACDIMEDDGSGSDINEEHKTKDELVNKESLKTEIVDTKHKFGSTETEGSSSSASKKPLIKTENKETPTKVEGNKKVKTPNSSGKRFSFQNSFKVVNIKEEEDSNESQNVHLKSSARVSESEGSHSLTSSKELDEVESELVEDLKSGDKITGKRKSIKMSAAVSQDSGESLMQRAMVVTSLAIQKEKKKLLKYPQKYEKESVEASGDDESSEVSEETPTEEITEKKDIVDENDLDSGSDDDMPESMSFDAGKEQMNQAVKMAVDAIRREKERIKEQRRKRMEMIRTQKKEKEQRQMEKLKMLEMKMPKRLSEDIVNRLPDAPEIPTIKDASVKKKKKKNKEKVEDVEMVPLKKNKIAKFDDYIPLDDVKAPTKFGVVPLDLMEKIPKSASEKAAEFKKQALFGSRIRREPSKNLLSYQQKIGAAFKSKGVNQQQRFKPY